MKKIFTLACLLAMVVCSHAQLLSWSPDFAQQASNPVVITMNATYGNQGLLNYSPTTDVYVHIGVITNKSTSSGDWRYVPSWSVWGTTPAQGQAAYQGNNVWTYTITGGLRTFFGITDPTEVIQKIAILFRNGTGSLAQRNADASDMYVPIYADSLYARIDQPYTQPEYVPTAVPLNLHIGDPLNITAKESQAGTLSIYFNGAQLATGTTSPQTASTNIVATGNQQIVAVANNGTYSSADTLNFFVSAPTTIAALPAGDSDGINYEAGDTSATLVLYAPHKNHIFVEGDFNNWIPNSAYQMFLTPDSTRFWIRLTGLTPGTEYGYQYLIDDSIKVADYNTEKVLDPSVDPYIPTASYPNLKPYPTGLTTGLVSVLQTGQQPYVWQVPNFVRPDKHNLVIYELLVRDFIAAQNWQTLTDTLTYLKRLGVNAIEVMPFVNFDGLSSWGYNPNLFFAPDKVYGTPTALKQFIDACHAQGMAVIMDLAMQDVSSTSPLAAMYWNSALGIPAANNPWLDQYPTHAYNVFNEFNHSSPATIALRYRVYRHWLNDYHLDGFRFDLAGGYTQNNTCDAYGNNCNVSEWNLLDQGRINTWDSIYTHLQAINPGSYCILESFVDNNENQLYANQGMLVWGSGNMNSASTQASMGYSTNPSRDMSSGLYSTYSGYTQPGLVDYQESHDETVGGDERIMFKNESYGNSSGSYNVKDTTTGLLRAAMTTAIWAMLPGPKMMWEFGELGYDYSPDACSNGTLDCGSTDPKPLPWATYYPDARRQALFSVYSKLFNLRNNPAFLATFTNNGSAANTQYSLSGPIKWLSDVGPNLQVVAYGNFDVAAQQGTVTFPSTGTWYNLFTGASINVASTSFSVSLQPGEYYVYVNTSAALPVQWLSFTAQKGNAGTILLNWATGNEINNDHFNVERSADGVTFATIGSVPAGKDGASIQNYDFTDQHPINGMNYYRIQQVDKNANYTYSKIIAISINGSSQLWQVYPNPAHTSTAVHVNGNLGNMQLVLTDAAGKKIFVQQLSSATTGQTINIPVDQLAKGVYLLQVTAGKESHTEKIVVQ